MNSFIDFFFLRKFEFEFCTEKIESFNLTREPKIDNKKHSEKIEKSPKLIIGKNWTKIEKSRPN